MKDVFIGVCIVLFVIFSIFGLFDNKRRIDKLGADVVYLSGKLSCVERGGYLRTTFFTMPDDYSTRFQCYKEEQLLFEWKK